MKKVYIITMLIAAMVSSTILYWYSLKNEPTSSHAVSVADVKKNSSDTRIPAGKAEEDLSYLTAQYAVESWYNNNTVDRKNVEVVKISHKKFKPLTRINSRTGVEEVILPVRVFATVKVPLNYGHYAILEIDVTANFYDNGAGKFIYDVVNTDVIKEEKF